MDETHERLTETDAPATPVVLDYQAPQQQAQEETQRQAGVMDAVGESALQGVVEGAIEVVSWGASGAVEIAGTVASGAVEVAGTVASGAVDVVGGVIGGIFDGL